MREYGWTQGKAKDRAQLPLTFPMGKQDNIAYRWLITLPYMSGTQGLFRRDCPSCLSEA